MSEVEKALVANATRCFDALHRVLLLWGALALAYLLLPRESDTATVKLSFSELQVPSSVARLLLLSLIFLTAFIGHSLLDTARRVLDRLADSENLIVVMTYPSIATTEARGMRLLFGLALACMQYSIAISLFTPEDATLWQYRFGLAFLYCSPMVFFAARLRWWDQQSQIK